MAIFESDIILARTPKEIERLSHKLVKGVGIKSDQFRWPRGEIPYVIESTLSDQNRVTGSKSDIGRRKHQFALFSAQTLMLHIIQTMYHLYSTLNQSEWSKNNFIVRHLLECRAGENRM